MEDDQWWLSVLTRKVSIMQCFGGGGERGIPGVKDAIIALRFCAIRY